MGKSTLAEEFGKNEYESYILVDFSKASSKILELFDDISNLDSLFMQLQFEFHVSLTPRKSLIIFAEVQFCPKARQAIKHLVADRRYDYIETGSLISISKKCHGYPDSKRGGTSQDVSHGFRGISVDIEDIRPISLLMNSFANIPQRLKILSSYLQRITIRKE